MLYKKLCCHPKACSVEDLQLFEGYQKKLNLTKPGTYRSQSEKTNAYTPLLRSKEDSIYEKQRGQEERLMCIDELHKFSDCYKAVRLRYSIHDPARTEGIYPGISTSSVRIIRVNSFTMKMEILLEPTSNKLMVDPHGSEGYLKMVVEVPDSSWLTRSIATCSYPTDKHKDIMKAQFTRLAKLMMGRDCAAWLMISRCSRSLCQIQVQGTSSIQEVNDHYNIFTRESQEYELKTKDKA
ncbi:hypothetical protein Tco_0855645 [Tanacetum coccineum]